MQRRSRYALGVLVVIVAVTALFAFLSVPQKAEIVEKKEILSPEYSKSDDVTSEIRNPTKYPLMVRISSPDDRRRAESLGIPAGDYGSFVVVMADKKADSDEVDLDLQPIETSVNLPGSSFDPILDVPEGTVRPGTAAPGGDGYYIVQFGTIASDDLFDSIKAAGVEVLQYVPHQAFLVYGSDEAIGKVAEHSRVRWVGRFLPEHKLSAFVKEQVASDRLGDAMPSGKSRLQQTQTNKAVFDISVFKREKLESILVEINRDYNGSVVKTIDLPQNYFNIIRAELPLDRALKVAEIPGVISIESYTKPEKEDERSAQIVAGNYTGPTVISGPGYDPLSQFGVNGQNVTVSVVDDGVGIPGDGGFYVTPSNAVHGPLRGATNTAQGHGHLQASIIAGDTPFGVLDPLGYNYGSGIAPKANIINIPLLRNGYSGSEADTANDTLTTLGPNGVPGYISNNSWGAGTNGNSYDSFAAEFDGLVRDASSAASVDPLVIVFSAGNSGNSGLTRPKMAKNIIAVGGSENLRSTLPSSGGSTGVADNIEQLPDFSSRGPASDTRIKPDITAPGDAVTGGRSGPSALFGNIDTHHRVSSGTSHAAPQVAGAAALFTQFWKNANGGTNPSPAMVKAALINGSVDMTGTGAASARPNGAEGWGRINLKNVLNTGANITYIDQSTTIETSGVVRTYNGTVGDISRPTRVSLVWTDPPGISNPALVNDLDLEVIVGGNTYKGNVLSAGSSVTGGTADNRNNVENVFLPAGITGPISVRIIGTAINGDGIPSNGDTTDQDFALVVFNANVAVGILPTPTPTPIPSPTPVVSLVEGDVVDSNGGANGDGLVLANDVSVMRQFVLGNLVPANSSQTARADVNGVCGDGSINAADITLVRQYSLGSLIPPTDCNVANASTVVSSKDDLSFVQTIAIGIQSLRANR